MQQTRNFYSKNEIIGFKYMEAKILTKGLILLLLTSSQNSRLIHITLSVLSWLMFLEFNLGLDVFVLALTACDYSNLVNRR
jgi:hypothetical protein